MKILITVIALYIISYSNAQSLTYSKVKEGKMIYNSKLKSFQEQEVKITEITTKVKIDDFNHQILLKYDSDDERYKYISATYDMVSKTVKKDTIIYSGIDKLNNKFIKLKFKKGFSVMIIGTKCGASTPCEEVLTYIK